MDSLSNRNDTIVRIIDVLTSEVGIFVMGLHNVYYLIAIIFVECRVDLDKNETDKFHGILVHIITLASICSTASGCITLIRTIYLQ